MNELKTCSKCGGKMIVRDSREKGGTVWRRRECNKCPHVIYTTEQTWPPEVKDDLTKIKLYGGKK